VKLNGTAVVATVIDSTQLTFKVPTGTSSGKSSPRIPRAPRQA
jgi:hypothetical protein